jgi:predicted nucleic acid-binding protein
MQVVDASVLVAALADTGRRGAVARRWLAGDVTSAPEVIDLEVLDSLRRLALRGVIPPERAGAAARELARIPVERVGHARLLARCWELRATVRPYDAAYVALAEARGIPLLTADAQLARAPGPRCDFRLVED